MAIEVLALVPLGTSFYFAYLSSTIGEEEGGLEVPLKWFFRLFSFIFLFPTWAAFDILASGTTTTLRDIMPITALTWALWTLIALVLTMLIARALLMAHNAKKQRFEEGLL